jgi:benzoate/toluate 1,2-dioxygenase alpha subunit
LVCHVRAGNKRVHACPYHGWTYDSSGKSISIKQEKLGAYPESFDKRDHNLAPVSVSSYRGFIFGCLNPDAPPLEKHLGDARVFLDLIVDQSPDGVELVPGQVSFTYNANWKMQLENCVDAYHFSSTHPSFLRVVERRADRQNSSAVRSTFEYKGWEDSESAIGSFSFHEGHSMFWLRQPILEAHPLYERREELEKRVGAERTRWMFNLRNFSLFPNVQLAENAALQMRIIRPIAVDLTEMTTYLVAPKGESPAARSHRIRQYEDFFNPSGLATPDDNVLYEHCQIGSGARTVRWSDAYSRGYKIREAGPNKAARELGISPAYSVAGHPEVADETLMQAAYVRWRELMPERPGTPEGKLEQQSEKKTAAKASVAVKETL